MAELFDILVRHQVYLEGLKKGRTADFPKVLAQLDRALKTGLAHIQFEDLGQLTKKKLNEILVELRRAMRSIFDPWLKLLVEWLERYMIVEVEAFNEYYGTDLDPQRVISSTNNEPMGANGLLWLPFLRGSTTYSMTQIERLVLLGYVNRLSPTQVANSFLGTKANNYRDGIGRRIDNANTAAMNTIIQHMSAQASMNAAKKVFGKYEWVSVLDDRTTKICTDRDGNIYVYGFGPLPPAHINCRSIIVPVSNDARTPELRFAMWAGNQSVSFIDDAFDGKAPARYEGTAPLTLAQYRRKRSLILSN